ncbi:MAG: chromate transporter [Clostridia bacterium]|nr:chromate transporter [Clostridia bacterium]
MSTLFWLFVEFFKTGLFAVGGGLATIPFIYDIAARYDWLDASQLPNMIAIAESTPGPIGVNVATYAGFHAAGILGAVVATLALITPSFIIILIVSTMLAKFRSNRYVSNALTMVRPVSAAMISAVAVTMVFTASVVGQAYAPSAEYFAQINWIAMALVAVFTFAVMKIKAHPIVFIGVGAVLGIALGYAGILK